MFNFIKNTFKRTNDCIILIAPLVIFISLFSFYINYTRGIVNNIPKLILSVVTCWIMVGGLLSAWFYMLKKTLKLSDKIFLFDKDRGEELVKIMFSFPRGIGKYFLSFLGAIFISGILYGGVFTFITYLVNHFIGQIDIDLINANNMLITGTDFLNKIRNFSKNELIIFNFWYLAQIVGCTILSFMLMFWIPEIIYKTLNPFKALIQSLKKLLSTFLPALLLFVYLNTIYLIISIINSLLILYPILYVLILIQFYYFIIYALTTIFTYYEQEFVKNE